MTGDLAGEGCAGLLLYYRVAEVGEVALRSLCGDLTDVIEGIVLQLGHDDGAGLVLDAERSA